MRTQAIAFCAFALAALCIAGAVLLVALNKTVPQDLWVAAFASLTGGAGLAVPTPSVGANPGGSLP